MVASLPAWLWKSLFGSSALGLTKASITRSLESVIIDIVFWHHHEVVVARSPRSARAVDICCKFSFHSWHGPLRISGLGQRTLKKPRWLFLRYNRPDEVVPAVRFDPHGRFGSGSARSRINTTEGTAFLFWALLATALLLFCTAKKGLQEPTFYKKNWTNCNNTIGKPCMANIVYNNSSNNIVKNGDKNLMVNYWLWKTAIANKEPTMDMTAPTDIIMQQPHWRRDGPPLHHDVWYHWHDHNTLALCLKEM